jgi:two-component system sensor histidine kinase ChiS
MAARLESLTKLYGVNVLISESTYQGLQAENRNHTRMLDEVKVKGRSDSVKLYEAFDSSKTVSDHSAYEKAFANYQSGDLEGARQGFQHVLDESPDDHAAEVFLERIDGLLKNGLPAAWDGIQIFQH